MREKKIVLIVSFHSTTQAMQMEKVCREQQLPGRMIPLPGVISAGCGLAWCCEPSARSSMEEAIAEYNMAYDAITEIVF
ncbi:MAG: DUF3343 domain-containing protein [Lachnospiraceae bacterium]